MSFLLLLVALVIIGVLLYFLQQIPMDNTFRVLIKVIAIIVAVYLILEAFGVIDYLRGVRVPHI